MDQPGLLRCLLYEKATVALGKLLGVSWRERCLGTALTLQCWTTVSKAISSWRLLNQQQQSGGKPVLGNWRLFSSPGKRDEIPVVSASAKMPLMLRPAHD